MPASFSAAAKENRGDRSERINIRHHDPVYPEGQRYASPQVIRHHTGRFRGSPAGRQGSESHGACLQGIASCHQQHGFSLLHPSVCRLFIFFRCREKLKGGKFPPF